MYLAFLCSLLQNAEKMLKKLKEGGAQRKLTSERQKAVKAEFEEMIQDMEVERTRLNNLLRFGRHPDSSHRRRRCDRYLDIRYRHLAYYALQLHFRVPYYL